GQKFRFEQHALEAEAFERIFLHDLHDGRGEVRADIAHPACNVRRGAAEATAAFLGVAITIAFAVERGQRTRQALIILAQRVILAAQRKTPPSLAFFSHPRTSWLRCQGCGRSVLARYRPHWAPARDPGDRTMFDQTAHREGGGAAFDPG